MGQKNQDQQFADFERAIKQAENFRDCAIEAEKIIRFGAPDPEAILIQEWEQARQIDRLKTLKLAYMRARKNFARKEKHAILTSMGLKRVRGALGGVYYE